MLLKITIEGGEGTREVAINPRHVLCVWQAADGSGARVAHLPGGEHDVFSALESHAEVVARWEAALRGGSDG